MSEDYFHLTVDGQELDQELFNNASRRGAFADDKLMAELLRLIPFNSTQGASKLIIGAGQNTKGYGQHIIAPAEGGITVRPFRAVIGSRSIGSPRDMRMDIRTALYAEANDIIALQPNTGTVSRIDLVCARVRIDQNVATGTRYVKTAGATPGTWVEGPQNVTLATGSVVDIQVVQGSNLSPPGPPGDGANTYFIPLAYVRIQASAGFIVGPDDIVEVAKMASINAAFGATVVRPANYVWDFTSLTGTYNTFASWWLNSANNPPPAAYLPPTMCGGEELLVPFVGYDEDFPTQLVVQDGDVVDSTRDWRNRLFEWKATGSAREFPWLGGSSDGPFAIDTLNNQLASGFGQSFHPFTLGDNRILVAQLTQSNFSALGAGESIGLYVDRLSGDIKARVTGTTRTCNVFFWIKASGQFNKS